MPFVTSGLAFCTMLSRFESPRGGGGTLVLRQYSYMLVIQNTYLVSLAMMLNRTLRYQSVPSSILCKLESLMGVFDCSASSRV